jgi:hypothetical protein
MSLDKKIEIIGTNNKYQINKLKKERKEVKTRKIVDKMGLPTEFFLLEEQTLIINKLNDFVCNEIEMGNETDSALKKIVSQIENKLSSYKQQDILKKRYHEQEFIKLKEVIKMLYECELDCCYCKEKTIILYDLVREMKQWTLDRINNDFGHNANNVIISCLDCNLKRRRTNKDAFLFTKQLNIVKS